MGEGISGCCGILLVPILDHENGAVNENFRIFPEMWYPCGNLIVHKVQVWYNMRKMGSSRLGDGMSGKPDRITFQGRMDDMLTTLRTEIVNGLRPKGSYLPSEIVLGEQFQVSKKSVRKALDILVNEGLITKIPRVGNRVSPPDTPPVTTLRFGIYPSVMEQDFLPELLERFYEKHPHIRVETVTLPYTKYSHSIRAYLEQGFLDAFTLNNRNFMDMQEADALQSLEPQSPLADQHPFLADLFTEQGILYSVPLMFSPIVLCYNKDLFKQCGLREPNSGWTWNRLLENAAEINRQTGIIGFFSHIESLNRFPIFLPQSGFRFAKDASGYRFTDPELWDILHSCRSLFHQQGFLPAFLSEGDGDAERLFKQREGKHDHDQLLRPPTAEESLFPVRHYTFAL